MENIPQKEIKFVAVYARVSTSNQEDQKTVEAQLAEVRKFVKENNYIITKEYIDEGWSGDILARPNLDQLRLDAPKRMWDAVVIYDPDRLGRQLFIQDTVIQELKKLGIETLFVTMPPIVNYTDKLMFGVRGLFAAYEKEKITDRFRIGKINRTKNNNQVLTTFAPYGYTYIPNKGKKGTPDYVPGHYEINEYEAEIIRKIFSWVGNDRLTLRAVIRKLQELRIKPRKSKRGVWSTSTLSTLLRHEVYLGTTYWGASYAVVPKKPLKNQKYKKVEKTSRKMRPKADWIAITGISPLVDKDLWDRVQLQLKKNFELLGRHKKNNYLLAGIIYCVCGNRRAGEGQQNGKHLYYRCNSRVLSFPLLSNCTEGGINARVADEGVWQRVKAILSSPELLYAQAERWIEENKNDKKSSSTIDIAVTQKEITKLQVQEDRFATAYSQQVISLQKFEEYVAPLRKKIADFENQILQANLEKMPKNEILLPSKDEIEAFTKEAVQHLENINFALRQIMVRQVVNKIIASRQSLQVYGLINLAEIYNVLRSENRNCRIAERGEVHAF